MAHDIFLRIQGIDGESQDASHTNEIDVLAMVKREDQLG